MPVESSVAPRKKKGMQWYRMDLHIHTPGSADYQEPGSSYIDVLRRAEMRSLDIIAFTDHNTVAGYATMQREIEQLQLLERLGRATPEESRLLAEYRRLLDKILVLPGFEFTATFGFHILGIFSPSTPVRQIEHLLLSLRIPVEALDRGITEVGASSDVLTAYRMINEAGGICIAAHVNTSHGVAMRGFDFGGQTKIAYTQDAHLHALEVTDLTSRSRQATARFFDGTKTEYPRRMRCIQGSDAHRMATLGERGSKNVLLGIGDRVTEVSLPERSFEALLEMFRGNDFSRSRAYNGANKPVDFVQQARETGPSLVQSFHETMTQRGGHQYSILADVCAFANTNGGTVYVGLSDDKGKAPVGIPNAQESVDLLRDAISRMITPALDVEIDVQETLGQQVIRIQVPRGADRPYAIEDNKIYVRDEAETSLAVRDEIVNLVRQVLGLPPVQPVEHAPAVPQLEEATPPTPPAPAADPNKPPGPPLAGVEIVGTEQKGETRHYTMHDLRNGNIVKNVTRTSARRLWHYAITQLETNPVDEAKVQWQGDYGLWQSYRRAGETRYDLVQRTTEKGLRVYYGVTEGGMHGPWQSFLVPETEEEEAAP
jgi:hypothetical protein